MLIHNFEFLVCISIKKEPNFEKRKMSDGLRLNSG